MIKSTFKVLVAIGLVLAASQAWATPIAPGQSAFAVAEPDPTGGAVVGGPMTTPMVGLAFGGTLTSTVIAGDPSNLLGGLTFIYEVANSPASIDAIGRLTVTGYDNWLTDMSFQRVTSGPIGHQPTTMDRSSTGSVVGFSFISPPLGQGALLPGMTSAVLVVQTNAPAYTTSIGNLINGSIASGPTFAPIPEPATLALLIGGLGMMIRRR